MEPTETPNSVSPAPVERQLDRSESAAPIVAQPIADVEDSALKLVVVAILIIVVAVGIVWGLKRSLPAPASPPSAEASKPPEPPAGSLEAIARTAVRSLVNEGSARFRTLNLRIGERDRQELAKSPERQRQTEETLVRLADLHEKRARRTAEVKKLREGWRGAPDEKEKNKALDDLIRAENGMREMTLDRLHVQLGPVRVYPSEIPATKGPVNDP